MASHKFKTVKGVIRHYGLKRVFEYVITQHALPNYCKRSVEAFCDVVARSPYGGMQLDEKVIEWANDGEIDRKGGR